MPAYAAHVAILVSYTKWFSTFGHGVHVFLRVYTTTSRYVTHEQI